MAKLLGVCIAVMACLALAQAATTTGWADLGANGYCYISIDETAQSAKFFVRYDPTVAVSLIGSYVAALPCSLCRLALFRLACIPSYRNDTADETHFQHCLPLNSTLTCSVPHTWRRSTSMTCASHCADEHRQNLTFIAASRASLTST